MCITHHPVWVGVVPVVLPYSMISACPHDGMLPMLPTPSDCLVEINGSGPACMAVSFAAEVYCKLGHKASVAGTVHDS